MARDINRKVLLVAAGPSGSGKTVFIEEFRAGRLDPELRALLPGEGAESWPQIGGNDCMKRSIPVEAVLPRAWSAPGGVVHYDTVYPYRFGLSRFEDDPAAPLFLEAARLVVVTVRPTLEALRAQFEGRLARQLSAKRPSHLMWKRLVRTPIELGWQRLTGTSAISTADVYANPVLLQASNAAWDAFVARLVAHKPGSRALLLEPGANPDTRTFSWKSMV